MITYSEVINEMRFYIRAQEELHAQVMGLFNLIRRIPTEKIKDGYKFELGFSVFILAFADDGYKVLVPDYTNSPFLDTTDDLTIALYVAMEQTALLKDYGVDGVSTRFDDKIVVATNALDSEIISMQRYDDLGKGASGWCIEALEESNGELKTIQTQSYESIYAYQLLKKRISLINALVLPYNYLVIYQGEEIFKILDENDNEVSSSLCLDD